MNKTYSYLSVNKGENKEVLGLKCRKVGPVNIKDKISLDIRLKTRKEE